MRRDIHSFSSVVIVSLDTRASYKVKEGMEKRGPLCVMRQCVYKEGGERKRKKSTESSKLRPPGEWSLEKEF
eukprot:519058-Amphidinium_carterae.1